MLIEDEVNSRQNKFMRPFSDIESKFSIDREIKISDDLLNKSA
jgi:hypothetical protein